jgi:hypothetical protein
MSDEPQQVRGVSSRAAFRDDVHNIGNRPGAGSILKQKLIKCAKKSGIFLKRGLISHSPVDRGICLMGGTND